MIKLPISVSLSFLHQQRKGRDNEHRKAEAPRDDERKARSRKQQETQSDLMHHDPGSAFDRTPCSALHPSAPTTILRAAPQLRRKSKALPTCCIRAMPPKRRKARFRRPSCCFLCSVFCAWCCGAIRQQPQPRPLREPRRPRQRQWRPRSRQPSQPRQQPSWRTPRHALP